MSTPPPPSVYRRWCDVDGTQITLFCWVEQVRDDPEPGILGSRLYQRGQIIGWGLQSVYVRFHDNTMTGLSSQVLRVLPDVPDER